MDETEAQEMMDSLFPVGKERWVKIKYLDQKKCINAFGFPMNPDKSGKLEKKCEEKGYQVTAIGVRDEYLPQVSALMDLKAEIIGVFGSDVPDYIQLNVNQLFKNKIAEIQKLTIKPITPNEDSSEGN